MLRGLRLLALIACALSAACGGDATPTAPGGGRFAGEWVGTTFQGRPITFTVSGEKVTAVSVGYSFSGCTGVDTLTGLDHEITLSGFTQFGASLAGGRAISVTIVFVADRTASGGVVFYGPSSCGSTGDGGPFSATKR